MIKNKHATFRRSLRAPKYTYKLRPEVCIYLTASKRVGSDFSYLHNEMCITFRFAKKFCV